MSDYLVRNDGTATGDVGRYAAGSQTGSFTAKGTANFYGSIQLAIGATTPPATGDRILVSSAHLLIDGSSKAHQLGVAVLVEVVCVDDANMENYRTADGTRGTEECTGTAADFTVGNDFTYRGIRMSSGDNFFLGGSRNTVFHDCEIQWADIMNIAPGDGNSFEFYNCDIIGVDSGTNIVATYAVKFLFENCVFTNLSGVQSQLFLAGFTAAGAVVEINNSDLSGITGTLFSNVGAAAGTDDLALITIDRCKLADGVVVNNEEFVQRNKSITMMRSAFASADAEYQYYYTSVSAQVDSDSAIRRADGQAFEDSGTQISYRVQTGTATSTSNPFTFEFPITQWAELTGSLDTLRFYVASVAAKNTKQVYFNVSYPDATNKNLITRSTSAPQSSWGGVDTMAAGVTLTTDSGSDWRDGVGAFTGNEYLVDVATTTGLDCYPTVTVTVTEASADFYIGSQFDLV